MAASFLENCQGDRCTTNGILRKQKNLHSQNGVYRLVLNDTGNLEIWCKREKIWTTNTDDYYVDFLIVDNDGKICLRKSKPHMMLLQNDGNLVVYNECGNSIWESKTKGKCGTIPGIYIFFIKI